MVYTHKPHSQMWANILFPKPTGTFQSATYRSIFSIFFFPEHLQEYSGSLKHTSITHFLKSASSLSISSLDSLLLSCLYRAEKRALLSSVPEASLNKVLQEGEGEEDEEEEEEEEKEEEEEPESFLLSWIHRCILCTTLDNNTVPGW